VARENKKIKKLEERLIEMVKQKKALENQVKKQAGSDALVAEHEKTIQEFEQDYEALSSLFTGLFGGQQFCKDATGRFDIGKITELLRAPKEEVKQPP
jgi:hypothetical protein